MQIITQQAQSNPIRVSNHTDENGNPTGGYAHGTGLCIAWQDGPRGKAEGGTMAPANGAFVEDALVAARQRLQFFQESKFKCEANGEAIRCIDAALDALERRAKERAARGTQGQHLV